LSILAGGIAHDFNNLLTGVLGNISVAKSNLNLEDSIYRFLDEAEKAAIRSKDLTQQLLTFAKGGAPVKKIVSVPDLIKESASFALRGSDVRCEFVVQEDLWQAQVDEGQISQVINNLIINADQAMPQGGVVRVKIENLEKKREDNLPMPDGEYLRISIQDHGIGIQEQHLQKIFDPYFTTKQKGSGLGLAIAYSIIKKHNGHISLESRLGEGTTFHIYLPASRVKEKPGGFPGLEPLEFSCRVLVMDDEGVVREVAESMLEHLGCDVETVSDGAEAVEEFKKARDSEKRFDIVLMDLTIPGGMGGEEAVKKLLEIEPDVKVIVSSGYSNDPIIANFRDYGFSGYVIKPYKMDDLSRTLRTILE
jgi:CheY-like chemotaxis protein